MNQLSAAVRRVVLLGCLLGAVLHASAQQTAVEGYKRLHRTWLSRLTGPRVEADKQQAILDLATGEKGFQFKADGKTEVQAQEGDGMLTLKLPHQTRFLVISHPDYGQAVWKVPGGKALRRKHHYRAVLHTASPTKEFKPGKQWVVMDITPQNAIVTMDSTTTLVRNGRAQFFLPLGTHRYKVESPFCNAVEDSVQVTDSARIELPVRLQTFYSFLTVRVPRSDYGIYVDDQYIGQGIATSGHLSPGIHQLTIRRGQVYYYDAQVTLQPAEKRVVELPADSLRIRRLLAHRGKQVIPTASGGNAAAAKSSPQVRTAAGTPVNDHVTITAPNDSAEIWVDLELKGRGTWQGALPVGFHLVGIKSSSMASEQYVFVEDTFPKTIDMMSPQEEYGMLNVHGNVVGAEVLVNGKTAGYTPCIVQRVPARYECEVTLRMDGYREVTRKVKPRGNDMVDMRFRMKRNH